MGIDDRTNREINFRFMGYKPVSLNITAMKLRRL